MDFSSEIASFTSKKIGGIVIAERPSRSVVYADVEIRSLYGEGVLNWKGTCPELSLDGPAVEWEYFDARSGRHFSIVSGLFAKDGKEYSIHQLRDATEFISLNRDITKYLTFFRKLSGFQTAVLEKMGNTCYELMPVLTEYFKTGRTYFFLQQNDELNVVSYDDETGAYSSDRTALSDEVKSFLEKEDDDSLSFSDLPKAVQSILSQYGKADPSVFYRVAGDTVYGQRYLLLLDDGEKLDLSSLKESTLINVIKIYTANGIMHEKLVYDSEHDMLTGLYNRGKLFAMAEKYRHLDSIGIFNLDVNNLKTMNDVYGHEAGDALIIKAASSIKAITGVNVHGYRMGGDEFMIIACDMTKEAVEDIKVRWEAALSRLNEADDGIDCVIAAGIVYGKGDYDYDALLKEADEKMYEDKKAKKKPGEEIR